MVDWGLAKALGRVEPGSARTSGRWCPSSASGVGRDAARQRAGHAGLHEPRAGRAATSTGWAAVGRLQPGRHALLPADRQAAVRGRRHRRRAPAGAAGRIRAAPAARPVDRPGAGGGLPEGDGDSSPRTATRHAEALADDIERWMADEPVTAWREPLSRRARRWARRNRTAVTALAAAVLVALAGTAAVLAVQTQANGRSCTQANVRAGGRQRTRHEGQRRSEVGQQREKQRFDLAMEAIKLFHGEVSDDLLLKDDQFEPLRDKLLKGARRLLRQARRPAQGPDRPRLARRWEMRTSSWAS